MSPVTVSPPVIVRFAKDKVSSILIATLLLVTTVLKPLPPEKVKVSARIDTESVPESPAKAMLVATLISPAESSLPSESIFICGIFVAEP